MFLSAVGVKEFAADIDDDLVVPLHDKARAFCDDGNRSGFEVFFVCDGEEGVDVFFFDHHCHSLLRFADGELSAIKAFVFLWDGVEVDR